MAYACPDASGDVQWAMKRCDNDISCKWLHDFNCDNKHWRVCPNLNIENYLNQKNEGIGCTKVKPQNGNRV